jgi:dihydropteroate synthase
MSQPATRPRFTWRLRSRSLPLGDRTLIMAILNVTPDSFSGDGLLAHNITRAAATKLAIALAVEAHDHGADILDLGAESTRPGAEPLEPYEELDRLLPVLEGLLAARPEAIVSVDTYHPETAREAARAGAQIINDVSGLTWEPGLADAVAATGCGLILTHTRGRPTDWATLPPLAPDTILPTICSGLTHSLTLAQTAQIAPTRIVLDPGFGFGKRGAENLTLLRDLAQLHELGRPILIGLSRKRFLGELIQPLQPPAAPPAATPATARRAATLAANTAAILSGAHILRVHDVQLTREAAAVADVLLREGYRS